MTKTELIAMLEDAYVKIDLLQQDVEERDGHIRTLKAQVAMLLSDRRAPDLKAG